MINQPPFGSPTFRFHSIVVPVKPNVRIRRRTEGTLNNFATLKKGIGIAHLHLIP
jgi:hypothetical protein